MMREYFNAGIEMAPRTSFKIGGKADYFVEVDRKEDTPSILHEIRAANLPIFILGGGTNVLFSDEGFRGVVLAVRTKRCKFYDDGRIYVEAGFGIQELVYEAAKRGFAGLEWAGGLPGSVGGAIRGNAGCFGGEVKDITLSVESITCGGEFREMDRSDCEFGYRTSVFREKGGDVIAAAIFGLVPGGDPKALLAAIEEKIQWRKSRQPLEYPNAGSIFKNIPVENVPERVVERFRTSIKDDPFPIMPAAKLVWEANLAGLTAGRAQISPKHTNFIVNLGGAAEKDVKTLIQRAKVAVKDAFGVILQEEICSV